MIFFIFKIKNLGYICSCFSGQRTNGCCVHVASMIYYFSNYLHKTRNQVINHPADYLNSVLVEVEPNQDDDFEPSNNPKYIRNRRRTVRETTSSSESDDDNLIPSDYDDDSESDMSFGQEEGPNDFLSNNSLSGTGNESGNFKRKNESEIDKAKKLIYDDLIERLTNDTLNKFYQNKSDLKNESKIDKAKKLIYDDLIERLTNDTLNKFYQNKSDNNESDKSENIKPILNVRPAGFLTERQLRNDAWLTDIEIVAFLEKIKEYLEINNIEFQGLRDPTVLTALRTDNINMRHENFVEVLFSNNNHWVCVAAGLNIANEDICLFDSMSRNVIDVQLGTTCSLLTALPRLEKGHLIFRNQNVTKQRRHFCGYFALANAMALCLGLDPERIIFEENQLRNHFINIIFKNQTMAMFPYRFKQRVNNSTNKLLIFELANVEYTDRQLNIK